jgi:hypothetical protein
MHLIIRVRAGAAEGRDFGSTFALLILKTIPRNSHNSRYSGRWAFLRILRILRAYVQGY